MATKRVAVLVRKFIAAGAVSIALLIAGSAAVAGSTQAAGWSTSSVSWDGFYHDM